MPHTCENWLGLVNSCIYYVWQTCEIHQALPHSVDFKAPRVIYVHQQKWYSLLKQQNYDTNSNDKY